MGEMVAMELYFLVVCCNSIIIICGILIVK